MTPDLARSKRERLLAANGWGFLAFGFAQLAWNFAPGSGTPWFYWAVFGIAAVEKNGHRAIWNVARRDRQSRNAGPNEKGQMMSEEEREKHFKAELHEAIDAAQTARTQARRLFSSTRLELIEEAKAPGFRASRAGCQPGPGRSAA